MMKTFGKLDRIIEIATKVLAVFSFIAIVFMMVFISCDVAGRAMFKSAIKGCYEIVEFAMGTCVFTSLAYTEAKHGHVHVTLVIGKMKPKLRIFFYALMSLLTTGLMAVAAYAAINQVGLSAASKQVTAVLKVPYTALYSMLAVSMVVFALTLLYTSIKAIIAIFNSDMQKEIESHWS